MVHPLLRAIPRTEWTRSGLKVSCVRSPALLTLYVLEDVGTLLPNQMSRISIASGPIGDEKALWKKLRTLYVHSQITPYV